MGIAVRSLRIPTFRCFGFTLVELGIVVVVMAIVGSMGVGIYGRSIARSRCEAAARRIVLDLAWATRRAQHGSVGQTVTFVASADTYQLPGVADINRAGQDYTVKLGDPPYEADLVSADFGGDAEVMFNAYGMPDSGGSVVVRVGSHTVTVVLDGATGAATIGAMQVVDSSG